MNIIEKLQEKILLHLELVKVVDEAKKIHSITLKDLSVVVDIDYPYLSNTYNLKSSISSKKLKSYIEKIKKILV